MQIIAVSGVLNECKREPLGMTKDHSCCSCECCVKANIETDRPTDLQPIASKINKILGQLAYVEEWRKRGTFERTSEGVEKILPFPIIHCFSLSRDLICLFCLCWLGGWMMSDSAVCTYPEMHGPRQVCVTTCWLIIQLKIADPSITARDRKWRLATRRLE